MRATQAVPRGRARVPACRTRSRHPCALIGCSRQPIVLQAGPQSLPEMPISRIMSHTGFNRMQACPAGRHPAAPRDTLEVARMAASYNGGLLHLWGESGAWCWGSMREHIYALCDRN
jgi:hypothetical protein